MRITIEDADGGFIIKGYFDDVYEDPADVVAVAGTQRAAIARLRKLLAAMMDTEVSDAEAEERIEREALRNAPNGAGETAGNG